MVSTTTTDATTAGSADRELAGTSAISTRWMAESDTTTQLAHTGTQAPSLLALVALLIAGGLGLRRAARRTV